MFTPPAIATDALLACLRDAFGVRADTLTFLPLGADRDTALFRAETRDGGRWFVRLRSGAWNPVAVTLPHALHAAGVREVIPPLMARDGRLWADLGRYRVIVLPWVDARNAYEVRLTGDQWVALGDAVRRLHDAPLAPEVLEAIPTESYGNRYRERLRTLMAGLAGVVPVDDLARRTVRFLAEHRDAVGALLFRTDALAAELRARSQRANPTAAVVCHTDLHAGNVLTAGDGALYLVDWDAPLRAPRERDLMYAGGGQFGNVRPPAEEEALFYRGYGDVSVDRGSLAYFRYARIIEDLAIYAGELLGGAAGQEDRALAYHYLASNVAPNGTLEIARDGDY